MLSEKENTRLSKLLSYILRHKPEEYGILLDENGYTNVDELLNKLNAYNENISFEILQYIVDANNKKRFALMIIYNSKCNSNKAQFRISYKMV
jgi:putative RNA 2'-phosphotransferase